MVRPKFGLTRRASLRINFALIMNMIPQRILDFDVIKDLCKFSSLDKCPLVFKTCNFDNCPLFYIVSLDDCDYAVECLTNDVF